MSTNENNSESKNVNSVGTDFEKHSGHGIQIEVTIDSEPAEFLTIPDIDVNQSESHKNEERISTLRKVAKQISEPRQEHKEEDRKTKEGDESSGSSTPKTTNQLQEEKEKPSQENDNKQPDSKQTPIETNSQASQTSIRNPPSMMQSQRMSSEHTIEKLDNCSQGSQERATSNAAESTDSEPEADLDDLLNHKTPSKSEAAIVSCGDVPAIIGQPEIQNSRNFKDWFLRVLLGCIITSIALTIVMAIVVFVLGKKNS